jgi:ribosomal protein L18
VTVANTIAAGNTSVTGFINVSSTANIGGAVTMGSTLATGNTSVTGFINVSSTANVGGATNLRSTLNVNGAVTVANTLATGNTSVTGFINVSSTANVGGATNLRSDLTVNGTTIIANTLATGNTSVTGFINVSSTANVGGIARFNSNVDMLASANVDGTLRVGGDLIVTGTLSYTGTSEADIIPTSNSFALGNSTSRWSLYAVTVNTSGDITVGGNLFVNSTTITIGNLSSNATVNTTVYSGTSNNATNLGGQSASYYRNADNINAGTLNNSRLNAANTSQVGVVQLNDTVVSTSIILGATANSVKNAYDRAIDANTRASSAQSAAVAAYSNGVTYSGTIAGTAYSNAVAFASNATNISSGTLNNARLNASNTSQAGIVQLNDTVVSTSIILGATANSVKTSYDSAIAANTRATSAQSAAVAAYSNAVTFASNATNISSGTLNNARLNVGTTSQVGIVQLIDSVVSTNTTTASTPNSVKIAYDSAIAANTRATSAQSAAVAAYSNGVSYTETYASNATNISSGTVNNARLNTATTSQVGIVQLVDSVTNTFITVAATANSVKTAYDSAIAANTRATSAQSAAVAAYSNGVTYSSTIAGTAYSNAVTFASNATNISSGTLNNARLNISNTTQSGIVQLVDSVVSTNTTAAATPNSVKTSYDAAIAANTRASSAQTAAVSAYSNAVNVLAPKASPTFTGIISLGSNVSINTSAYFIGNSSQNSVVNSSGLYINGVIPPSGGGYYKGNYGTKGEVENKGNLYRLNSNTQTSSVTILAGENALTVGPIVIADGYNLTIDEGGRGVII